MEAQRVAWKIRRRKNLKNLFTQPISLSFTVSAHIRS